MERLSQLLSKARPSGRVVDRAFYQPSQADVRRADQAAAELEAARSVMSQPMGQPWRPEYEQEPGLEAPMFSPDDLIGSGVGKAVLMPLAAALGVTAIGSKAAGRAGSMRLADVIPGQRGATAWHGSPHKFEKFDLSKIGTGEGAQAYGHGAYLAEAPAVAQEYKRALSGVQLKDGSVINPDWTDPAYYGIQELAKQGGDIAKARPIVAAYAEKVKWPEVLTAFDDLAKKGPDLESTGHLYKTDIPDEAVARFLDWDKPLSQQAPEVQAAMRKLANHTPQGGIYREMMQPFEAGNSTGGALQRAFMGDVATTGNAIPDKVFSMMAHEYGVPGIRYLDGGSRGAGQGSSNFVIFDPEMIRILERNGVPTGAQPWQPGEYQMKLSDLLGE